MGSEIWNRDPRSTTMRLSLIAGSVYPRRCLEGTLSALLIGRAMYVPLDMASRLTLVALVDHAHDDGTEARPGLRRLTIKTGLSRRAVQDCLAHLEGHGLIKASGYRRGGHGRATNWTVNVIVLRMFTDWYEDDPDSYEAAVRTVQELHPLKKNSAACDRKQCSVAQLTVQRAAPQPSGTIKKQEEDSSVENRIPPRLPGESHRDHLRRVKNLDT